MWFVEIVDLVTESELEATKIASIEVSEDIITGEATITFKNSDGDVINSFTITLPKGDTGPQGADGYRTTRC